MQKYKIYNLLKYLCLAFVLSYFFINNIIFVIIGITISLYLINIDFLNGLINRTGVNINDLKLNRELNKNEKEIKKGSENSNIVIEDSKQNLVEIIEEFGIIPSIRKSNDENQTQNL